MRTVRNATQLVFLASIFLSSCRPSTSFDFEQRAGTELDEVFEISSSSVVSETVPLPIDLLWVVDNSGSMGDDQTKLASSFKKFAERYFNSKRDIRIARITTDAYRAGSKGTDCGSESYCAPENSLLLPGWSDGSNPPRAGFPRSGKPILSTLPPDDFAGSDDEWLAQLKEDFATNVKVGVDGSGDERGMQSIFKFLSDNEQSSSAANRFFRKGSVRALFFVSDELDSSRLGGGPAGEVWEPQVIDYHVRKTRDTLNRFFQTLDEADETASPGYFVSTVINRPSPEIDCAVETRVEKIQDCRAPLAYEALVRAVQNDPTNPAGKESRVENIAVSDFDAILAELGKTIDKTVVTYYSRFTLRATPRKLKVIAQGDNGQERVLEENLYEVVGQEIRFKTDLSTLQPKVARIRVKYEIQAGS